MSGHDARVRPEHVLLEAARLIAVDGWDVDADREPITRERRGRFYSPSTLAGALHRAIICLRAGWYVMVRAAEALYRSLGLTGERPRALTAWERSGLTPSRIERALRRAAYQIGSPA